MVHPAVVLPLSQRQVRGLNLRRSKRWLDAYPRIGGAAYSLPLIDRLGRFTGASAYTLACNPSDVLSTTVATIHSRLKRYAHAHNRSRTVSKHLRLLLKVAAYYALTKNSYYMDRILYLIRHLEEKDTGKRIHATTLKYLVKCDADIRFVYGQVCYQTNWLIFRACRPRDKSHYKIPSWSDLGFLGRPGYLQRKAVFRSTVTTIAENVATIGRTTG